MAETQTKTKRCPICQRRVPVAQHPSPAWRSLRAHRDGGGQCPGTGRSVAEATELMSRWNQTDD